MTPLIVLAFANDKNDSLDLKSEYVRLTNLFSDETKLEALPIEGADVDKLTRRLTAEQKDRTVIFHYAGHANGKAIKLLDGEAKIAGFSRLLAEFKNLQLVFLNGCETFEQAEKIQALSPNVAVLTTIFPVADDLAVDFAYYFYLAYYNMNSLRAAFENAQTRILLKKEGGIFICPPRSFGLQEEKLIKDGNTEIYALSAPGGNAFEQTLILNLDIEKRNKPGLGYKPNKNLILEIARSIATGDFYEAGKPQWQDLDELKVVYNQYMKDTNSQTNDNLRKIVEKLLSILPYPIGFHLNLMISNAINYFASEEQKVDLLKQQVITYNCMTQLLCYMLLSCLWIEIEAGTTVKKEPREAQMLADFFSSEERSHQEVNFAMLLVNLHNILEANSLKIFVSEYQYLKNIFKEEEELHKAHLFIQGVSTSIQNKTILRQDVNRICMEAENILCRIFGGSGFIVKYKLATVKNIELIKSRLKSPSYLIKRIILNRFVVVEDDVVEYAGYTNTQSVILAKGLEPSNLIDFLPLSPFLIDENAMKGENLSKLYFYSHYLGEDFVFRLAEDPDKILLVKENDTYQSLYRKGDDEVLSINTRMGQIWNELTIFRGLMTK